MLLLLQLDSILIVGRTDGATVAACVLSNSCRIITVACVAVAVAAALDRTFKKIVKMPLQLLLFVYIAIAGDLLVAANNYYRCRHL